MCIVEKTKNKDILIIKKKTNNLRVEIQSGLLTIKNV